MSLFQNSKISELELLQRLVFAEGISTNLEANEKCRHYLPQALKLIAYGVINRVHLSRVSDYWKRKYGDGVYGVIFKKGQFNPAVSKHSKFSEYFLCPTRLDGYEKIWKLASEAAEEALHRPENNPLILTDWEKKNRLSLVSHFYYPLSTQATSTPPIWARTPSPEWIKDLRVDRKTLPDSCLWFFRHEKPRKSLQKPG